MMRINRLNTIARLGLVAGVLGSLVGVALADDAASGAAAAAAAAGAAVNALGTTGSGSQAPQPPATAAKPQGFNPLGGLLNMVPKPVAPAGTGFASTAPTTPQPTPVQPPAVAPTPAPAPLANAPAAPATPPAAPPQNIGSGGGMITAPGMTAPQPNAPAQNGGGTNAAPQNSFDARLAQMAANERQDLGVAPTSELRQGAPEGPTPNGIPGGQVITTQGLVSLMQNNQVRFALFDVLGGPDKLPNAISAVPASAGGTYDDFTEQQFGQFLAGVTGGNKQTPLVFYCLGMTCWMSYNASLRAIHLGYSNVLWYRGGIEAWQSAGLPTQPQQQMMQQPQQMMMQPMMPGLGQNFGN